MPANAGSLFASSGREVVTKCFLQTAEGFGRFARHRLYESFVIDQHIVAGVFDAR
jgi:hypothetical protein